MSFKIKVFNVIIFFYFGLLKSIESAESNRLPTNIETNLAEKYLMSAPLTWFGFDKQPLRMQFENTGFDGNFMQIFTQTMKFFHTIG